MIFRTLILAAFLYSTGASYACQELRQLAKKNARDYSRLMGVANNTLNSAKSPEIKIRVLSQENPLYLKHIDLLNHLKKAGGNGFLIETFFAETGDSTGFVALKVTTSPTEPIYGTQFALLHDKIGKLGRGVFIFDTNILDDGTPSECKGGFACSSGVYIKKKYASNVILAHELGHIEQHTSRFDQFFSRLIPISPQTMSIVEKAENGLPLTEVDQFLLDLHAWNRTAKAELDAAWTTIRYSLHGGIELKTNHLIDQINNGLHIPIYRFVDTFTGFALKGEDRYSSLAKTLAMTGGSLGAVLGTGWGLYSLPEWMAYLLIEVLP